MMARGDRLYARIECDFILTDPEYLNLKAGSKLVYLTLWICCVNVASEQLPSSYNARYLHLMTRLDHRTIKKCVAELQQKCLIGIDDENCITVYGVKKKHPRLKWKDCPIRGNKKLPTGNIEVEVEVEVEREVEKESKRKTVSTKTKSLKIKYSDQFENFWQTYPRRVAKGAAWKAWQKIKPDKTLTDEILEAVKKQAASRRWQKELDFIPHPATWLNQHRWEDEIYPTEEELKEQREQEAYERVLREEEERKRREMEEWRQIYGDDVPYPEDRYAKN